MSDTPLDRPITRRSALRFLAFGAVAAGALGVEGVRLAWMQLLSPDRSTPRNDATHTASKPIPSVRGLIYDRAGRLLVTNVPIWTVKVRPSDLPFSERTSVVTRLGPLIGKSPADINIAIDSNPGSTFDLVTIARGIPEETARLCRESDAIYFGAVGDPARDPSLPPRERPEPVALLGLRRGLFANHSNCFWRWRPMQPD